MFIGVLDEKSELTKDIKEISISFWCLHLVMAGHDFSSSFLSHISYTDELTNLSGREQP